MIAVRALVILYRHRYVCAVAAKRIILESAQAFKKVVKVEEYICQEMLIVIPKVCEHIMAWASPNSAEFLVLFVLRYSSCQFCVILYFQESSQDECPKAVHRLKYGFSAT